MRMRVNIMSSPSTRGAHPLRCEAMVNEWLRHGIPWELESWQGVSLRCHRMAFQSRIAVPLRGSSNWRHLVRVCEVAIECGSSHGYANITEPLTREYPSG